MSVDAELTSTEERLRAALDRLKAASGADREEQIARIYDATMAMVENQIEVSGCMTRTLTFLHAMYPGLGAS